MRCGLMDRFGDYVYLPILKLLRYPLLGLSIGISMLLITVCGVKAGLIPFNPFPKSDSNQILAQIVFPDGTPMQITDEATQRIERSIRKVSEDHFIAEPIRKPRIHYECKPVRDRRQEAESS